MEKPPVAFFIFNRPDCTGKVFEKIREYRPGTLLLVADGPRPSVVTDAARCEAAREIRSMVDWPCDVRYNFSEQNLGCQKRVASGLDWVFSQVEEAIILEDDCVPCPEFFEFCAELLVRYRHAPEIALISGDNFQGGNCRGDGSYYFSRYVHVWGWASWRRAWIHYDVSLKSWPQARENGWLDSLGMDRIERDYWTGIFDRTHSGQINTWDYQWLYACWRHGLLGIIPNVNLVTNIGASPDATHTKGEAGSLALPTGTLSPLRHPSAIARDLAADLYTFDGHYGGCPMRIKPGIFRGIRHRLKRIKMNWQSKFTV